MRWYKGPNGGQYIKENHTVAILRPPIQITCKNWVNRGELSSSSFQAWNGAVPTPFEGFTNAVLDDESSEVESLETGRQGDEV